jgi:hypothetical protein
MKKTSECLGGCTFNKKAVHVIWLLSIISLKLGSSPFVPVPGHFHFPLLRVAPSFSRYHNNISNTVLYFLYFDTLLIVLVVTDKK